MHWVWPGDFSHLSRLDADTLAELPEDEAKDWRAFWAEVEAVLADAGD
jgi:hypothetical protein